MGTYIGTNLNDIIIPGFVSAGVFRFPLGSTPGAAADTINGNGGNDTINGGLGNDTLNGGDGNDVIVGGGGADVVNGGNGNDRLTGGFGVGAAVFGGAGNDLIFAVNGTPEFINGGTGIDTLNTTAFGGNYVVNLTTGATNFAGESFINMENLIAGAGNDTLIGTAGANTIDGGAGSDTISGLAGNDVLRGGLGNDTINGGLGNDSLFGGDGNDVIVGGGGADFVDGGNGNDRLTGGFGAGATVLGGAGNDLIFAVNGTPEFINGGTGVDTLNTTAFAGNYVVNLTTGATNFAGESFINMENLIAGAGNDTLVGTNGTNIIDGGNGNDTISGLAGNDLLRGGNGKDTLFGGIGNDQLRGGAGNDRLIGGPGVDTLVGGLGNDVFAFFANDSFPGGRDTIVAGDGAVAFQGAGITLFGAPNDRIDLSAMDANTATAVNDAFVFGGAGTGHVVLVNEAATGNTLVRASTDADNAFEVEIAIADGAGVTAANYWAGDFVL